MRRYRVHEVLGQGGFGTVYRADLLGDQGFTKPIALKILHPHVEARRGELGRLRDEARILGLADHRALVRVDALVRLEGRWAVVMELVRGLAFEELRLRLGALPAGVVLEAAAEVASALDALYHLEVDGRPLRLLHRDIKPSNVLVTASGDVKLLDFGVARAEFEAREARTVGVVYGSPAYLSPERLELHDSPAGDVFALGISIAELLTGRAAEPVVARPGPHAQRVARLLEAVSSAQVGEGGLLLLRSMLSYDAEDRPTAAEVAAALRPATSPLRAWATQIVPAELDARGCLPGALSGSVLVEDGPATPPPALSGGFLTWDEEAGPNTTYAMATRADPVVRRPARTMWVGCVSGVALVASGVLGVGLAAIAGVLIAFGWFAVPGITRETCLGMTREMAQQVSGATGSVTPVRGIVARAERGCRSGELGILGANSLLLDIQWAVRDGVIDAGDLDAIRATERAVLGTVR